ncbi:hypothetical protein A5886_000756 [Enterococcus sp. 8G7_MSG3316]|uniref:Amidohydrolase 3 domain-containing protein n=1 Tax=Candidatus Enterococcus testudinis TaxID=1834191 RepID=A0A242A4M3_9ENTE|nr:amidohydrolase [Enterococcus sp. 8G7_MSG3316]OTN75681.1 hypothetical protein A5886_000756 [Enterococcus sp. 8G7_MSG3316]
MALLLTSNFIFDTESQTTFSGYLLIEGHRIIDRGQRDQLPQTLPHDTEIIDLNDQMVIPGLIDAHVHFYLSALLHQGALTHITGLTEEAVACQVPLIPVKHGWKIGIGWFSSDFGQQVYPTKASIDHYCSDIPVMLIAGDAHSIWLNSRAIEVLGITPDRLPQGISGEALMENNRLTGCFLEAIAIHYLAEVLHVFQLESPAAFLAYMQQLNQYGITTIGDVALTGESWDDLVYPALYNKTESAATVRTVFYPAMREDTRLLEECYQRFRSEKVQMGGVKQFFDGVTSTHTAFLKERYETPYFDGDVGMPLIDVERMRQLILTANQQDWPMRIHTIGDRAIQQALRYYQESAALYPLSAGKYNTLEHLEVMDAADLPLVEQEQLVLSVQPSHLLVGWETLDEEVGEKRAQQMFPFRSFLQQGATLAFGTDTPVVIDVTPLDSIYYAVARSEKNGQPAGGLMPTEKISIADALYAHTAGAAKALSRQDIGGLEVGQLADICILSENILSLSPEELLEVKVAATIFDGQFVVRNT